jgi:lysophospholipase L1-like esterase
MNTTSSRNNMRLHHLVTICLLVVLPGLGMRASESPHLAPFPDATRYMSLGDSITGGGFYHSYVHLFHITRFPSRTLEWINAGVSGDTAGGALRRMAWDVFPAEPDIVSIMFGMNEVGGYLFGPGSHGPEIEARRARSIDGLEANLRQIIQALQQRGAQVVLCTPSIYDETALLESPNHPGRNAALGECAARVRRLGEELNLAVVDFYTPMLAINLKYQEKDPSFTLISRDRVHPGREGHFVMAYQMLKAQQAPAVVARVEIDAAADAVIISENCSVENLQVSGKVIRFDYLAEALPYPVDEGARKALDWVPFIEDFNQEVLTVTGLPAGTYRLEIDSVSIRTFTAEAFERGINLAEETNTPQYRQALQVMELFRQRWALVRKLRAMAFVEHGACRDVPRPLTLEQVKPRLDAWVETSKGKSYEGFFRRCAQDYLVDKLNESEMLRKIEELLPVIQRSAAPVRRTIVITPSQ